MLWGGHLHLIPSTGEAVGKEEGGKTSKEGSWDCLTPAPAQAACAQEMRTGRELRSIASVEENRTASQKEEKGTQVQIADKIWSYGVPASLALGDNKNFC